MFKFIKNMFQSRPLYENKINTKNEKSRPDRCDPQHHEVLAMALRHLADNATKIDFSEGIEGLSCLSSTHTGKLVMVFKLNFSHRQAIKAVLGGYEIILNREDMTEEQWITYIDDFNHIVSLFKETENQNMKNYIHEANLG